MRISVNLLATLSGLSLSFLDTMALYCFVLLVSRGSCNLLYCDSLMDHVICYT